MKTSRRSGAAWCLVAALGLPPGWAAAEEMKAAPAETHVLFMGADLSVKQDGKVYRVIDVSGSEFKIRIADKELLVPTRQGVGLKVDPALKLTDTAVKLDELESGPGYTPANDPARKQQAALSASFELEGGHDMVQADFNQATTNAARAVSALEGARPESIDAIKAEIAKTADTLTAARYQLDTLNVALASDVTNIGAGAYRAQTDLSAGNFDAMKVSFKISSEVELEAPYLVVLYRFRAPDAKPGTEGLVIHAQALDPIGPKPRSVFILRGGLPVGFTYVGSSVHIYSRGREVATNLSENRVELTRDETRQYLVMEHMGEHKGATVAAAAVRGTLPRGRRESLSHDQLTRTVYVKVTPDGTPLGIFANESCELQIDDSGTTAAVGDIFFRPALQQGKPIEGVARVRLADL